MAPGKSWEKKVLLVIKPGKARMAMLSKEELTPLEILVTRIAQVTS
jgi:hypothetical protein